jgi:hypothetical protein
VTVPGISPTGASATNGPRADTDRGRLYYWDPFEHRLVIVDAVARTIVASIDAPTAAARGSLVEAALRAFGCWIAPTAAAKVLLEPPMLLSPDGSRLYALGVTGTNFEDGAGSAGVFVFDIATPAFVARWAPTADIYGIALSADGSALYASGLGGVNAAGETASQPASLTAYDTRTGDVRLILGALRYQADLRTSPD